MITMDLLMAGPIQIEREWRKRIRTFPTRGDRRVLKYKPMRHLRNATLKIQPPDAGEWDDVLKSIKGI